jgi:glycosyltransferase involved in cell wall biosynthesis
MSAQRFMRIAINSAVISGQMTGVGYHALSLARALGRVGQNVEWFLIGADPSVTGLPCGDNIQIMGGDGLAGGPHRALWQQWTLPRLAARAGVDLLYCPDYSRPVRCAVPVVNTIHDLSFYSSSPPFLPLPSRLWKGALARLAIERSARLVAVSEFTRTEILRRFPIDRQRVEVIHEAAEELPAQSREQPRHPFVLFVGTLETRKNLVTLIEAFTALRRKGHIAHRLILVGKTGYGGQRIHSAIAASPFRSEIEVRGYETQPELLRLYRCADLFVFPSVYEGFGLPLLEAMRCGTPVVCSRAASLPEVAGDAAEYFDPASAEQMSATIERVLLSPDLQDALRQKGRERVKQFSWDECARRYCQLFRETMQS